MQQMYGNRKGPDTEKEVLEMKIWLLKRKGNCGYDENDAVVVNAHDEQDARNIANQHCGCEGGMWTDPLRVSCDQIGTTRLSRGLVLASNTGA